MNARVILSIVIVVLGGTAAILPDTSNSSLELTEVDLHRELLQSSHYISVDELSDLLINQDPSIQLIDVRPVEKAEINPLPGAINIPLDSLFTPEKVYYIDQTAVRNIFYSDDDQLAVQAWMITRQKGFENNYMLKGGLEAWKSTILNPEYPEATASGEAFELYEKRAAASRYFTGGEVIIKPQQTPLIPVQRRDKKQVQGGCS